MKIPDNSIQNIFFLINYRKIPLFRPFPLNMTKNKKIFRGGAYMRFFSDFFIKFAFLGEYLQVFFAIFDEN